MNPLTGYCFFREAADMKIKPGRPNQLFSSPKLNKIFILFNQHYTRFSSPLPIAVYITARQNSPLLLQQHHYSQNKK